MNLLNQIIEYKKLEVAERRKAIPEDRLALSPLFNRPVFSLASALRSNEGFGIIAEFKRRSPSRGIINRTADPGEVAAGYAVAGAAGVSVLTDLNYFGGTADDLVKARQSCNIPLLRKDFIIDRYQITEARAAGADAILLIAAVLSRRDALRLAGFAHENGMEVLMEFHNRDELAVMNDHVSVAGINNRDLTSFKVDTAVSHNLYKYLPDGLLKISESGISSVDDIIRLRETGYDGFLIGGTFMKSEDPALSLKQFMDELNKRNKG